MTKSPHFWWIIILMGLTIIALIAFIITGRVINSAELMEYVSVCSMLLSITLSVFAIQYTYTSNNEVHQQFEKINAVAEGIKATSAELAATNTYLNNNLNLILEHLEKIDQSQQTMNLAIQSFTNTTLTAQVNNFSSQAQQG